MAGTFELRHPDEPARLLRAARKKQELSRRRFAKVAAGLATYGIVTADAVGIWEGGRVCPPGDVLLVALRMLGVELPDC